MALPQSFMDDLRRRVALSSVIGRNVKLQKRGNRLVGLCPFHNEKTPSFYVNDDEGFYKCFGCGVGGDAISYLREKDGMGFMEAVRYLAELAGIAIPDDGAPRDPEAGQKRDGRLAALEDTARIFAGELAKEIASGGAVAGYLASRAIGDETIAVFRLGYAPKTGLLEALKAAGHSENTLVEAGIFKRSERGDSIYPYFRHRLVFPIMDMRGRVIAFGGRALEEDQQPKYLNSPETPQFVKKSVLYSQHTARAAVREAKGKKPLVVTEGYMDAIAVTMSGAAASVAPLGTALTEEQIALLWRIHDEPLLCFDGDDAGRMAALKAILRALPLIEPGKSLRLMLMPPGQDPDDVLRGDDGKSVFTSLMGQSLPLVEGLWRGLAAGYGLGSPAGKAAFWREIREHIRKIGNGQMRASLGDEIESRIAAMRAETRGGAAHLPIGWGAQMTQLLPNQRGHLILALLVEHPDLIAEYYENIAWCIFDDRRLENLRQTVVNAVNISGGLDTGRFRYHLEENGFGNMRAGTILEGMKERIRYDPAAITIEEARDRLNEAFTIEKKSPRKRRSIDQFRTSS